REHHRVALLTDEVKGACDLHEDDGTNVVGAVGQDEKPAAFTSTSAARSGGSPSAAGQGFVGRSKDSGPGPPWTQWNSTWRRICASISFGWNPATSSLPLRS